MKKRKIVVGFFLVMMMFLLNLVTLKAETVKLSKKSLTLEENMSFKLKMRGTSKEITWKSLDEDIAIVSHKGKVEAKNVGSTLITATVGGKKYTCKLKVVPLFKLTEEDLAEELDSRNFELFGNEFCVNEEELEDIKIKSQTRSKDNKTLTVVAELQVNRTIATFSSYITLTYQNKKSKWKLSDVEIETSVDEWNLEGLWRGETTAYDYTRNKSEDRKVSLEITDVKEDGLFSAEARFEGSETDVLNFSGEFDTETGEMKMIGLDWVDASSKIAMSLEKKAKAFSLYLVPDFKNDAFVTNEEISKKVSFTSDTVLEKVSDDEDEDKEEKETKEEEDEEDEYEE